MHKPFYLFIPFILWVAFFPPEVASQVTNRMISNDMASSSALSSMILKDTSGAFISCIRTISPDTIIQGSEFLVEIEVLKTEGVYSMDLTESIPNGFTAIPVNDAGAAVSFKFQKLRFNWSQPPTGKISYRVRMTGPQKGSFQISGALTASKYSQVQVVWDNQTTIPQPTEQMTTVYQYIIPPSDFYVTKGIRLIPGSPQEK